MSVNMIITFNVLCFPAGVEHALKLTLNTENYERTAGPHDTTGIKLLMTDQHEVPRVEDIGIALSTGIHAFVGISVMTVSLSTYYNRRRILKFNSVLRIITVPSIAF